ncbi:MAG: helix-turn-helix transcriptional regulator [Ruminococcaceae bacterium]|nr:helix-turn-helix transcriptional regulator [Oscillospiraceae bacterium]
MTLGERIRTCRQTAGLSQEKTAELVGVSRQAVTKWETGQSAPNTENLFRLAEIFGTTVDFLLHEEKPDISALVTQIHTQYRAEEEKRISLKKESQRKNILAAVLTAAGFLLLYLIGRLIWCYSPDSSVMGWLFIARPSGEHSYLFGWLLHQKLFWYSLAVTAIPSLFGRRIFSLTAFSGFVVGFISGILFGPNPAGAATGHTHYGWAIWGVIFLLSIAAGAVLEKLLKIFQNKKQGTD